jgi:hypothetical protein
MIFEILGYSCVALVCMKVGAFLERRRTGGRCANTSTNTGMVQLLAVEHELSQWPVLSQYMRERIISRLSQQHHT